MTSFLWFIAIVFALMLWSPAISAAIPTCKPTYKPTNKPTYRPTYNPSQKPTKRPTSRPTAHPTHHPTAHPTAHPTVRPKGSPTSQPTSGPTASPSILLSPTLSPSAQPSVLPTAQSQSEVFVQGTFQTGGNTSPSISSAGLQTLLNTISHIYGGDAQSGGYETSPQASSVPARLRSQATAVSLNQAQLLSSPLYTYSMFFSIVYNLIDYPEVNSNVSALMAEVNRNVTKAIDSGSATTYLRQQAIVLGASEMTNSSAKASSFSYSVYPAPSPSSSSSSSSNHLTDAEIAGLVVGIVIGSSLIGILLYWTIFLSRKDATVSQTNQEAVAPATQREEQDDVHFTKTYASGEQTSGVNPAARLGSGLIVAETVPMQAVAVEPLKRELGEGERNSLKEEEDSAMPSAPPLGKPEIVFERQTAAASPSLVEEKEREREVDREPELRVIQEKEILPSSDISRLHSGRPFSASTEKPVPTFAQLKEMIRNELGLASSNMAELLAESLANLSEAEQSQVNACETTKEKFIVIARFFGLL